MPTFIRLTDYKSSEEKEQEFFNLENRYEVKQEDFEKIPGSPIAYWVSDTIRGIFNNYSSLSYVGQTREGLTTGHNDTFMRYWHEVILDNIGLNIENREVAKSLNLKWFPYNKGGEFQKWYGNIEFVVDWKNDGQVLQTRKHPSGRIWAHNFNLDYIFNPSISWTALSNKGLGFRYFPKGFLFDANGLSFFPNNEEDTMPLIALLNTKISSYLTQIINSTIKFNVGDIAKIPITLNNNENIINLAKRNIDISKEEWDSRETSWDFAQNELLRILNDEFLMLNEEMPTLETVYNRYCEYWKEKFFTLHKNEEELNRLFIDIYELQDELTPDVALKDITILKNEAKIIDGELVFQADEIMKQFISYGVGVMLGRYSLDHKGLHVANMNESLDDANLKFNIENPIFEADDDNIIPVLEDDYFKDDIASRFVQFVKTTFGEKNLIENIHFIEDALGTTIRKYFVKYFYPDHIKRYKKRPIYWMVSSPKKGFNALIYMHRYKSDTFARVRNSYLTEYIAKLEAHKETLALTIRSSTASSKDKKDADKAIKNIEAKLKEIIAFDRDAMMHYAQNNEEIDLDDGVKVNYCKFKDILYPIDKKLCEKKK